MKCEFKRRCVDMDRNGFVIGFLRRNYFAILCLFIDCIVYVSSVDKIWKLLHVIKRNNFFDVCKVDVFTGLAEKSVELILGSPLSAEIQDDDKRRGAIWWPSWSPQSGNKPVAILEEGQIGSLKLYDDNGRSVYVWFVEDTNHVWRVVKDIALPAEAVE